MPVKKEVRQTGWREAWGILLLALCVLMFLSVISYDAGDIRFLQDPPNQPARNYIGPTGAWFSFLLFMGFGVAGYLSPLMIAGAGLMLLFKREGLVWTRMIWLTIVFLCIVVLLELQAPYWAVLVAYLNAPSTGGFFGYLLGQQLLIRVMGHVGAGVLTIAILLTGLTILSNMHPREWLRSLTALLNASWTKLKTQQQARQTRAAERAEQPIVLDKRRQRLEEAIKKRDAAAAAREASAKAKEAAKPLTPPEPEPTPPPNPKPTPVRKAKSAPEPTEPLPTPTPVAEGAYQLPPLELLQPVRATEHVDYADDHKATATILTETLAEFGIEAQVTNVERGPVVTRFELLPAPGVKLEKIVGLSNNIALVMKAESVRVQAPIPGKGVVGIEVPNSTSSMVFMREVMESRTWKSGKAALPLALGKDVGGDVLVADLADMPHMLIAGATGSGKTVCMNSILAGLLMSRTPDEMRMMLVDPKIVEFSGYEGLPHLVVPVITDPKKVSLGLRWAINEMERRYKLFAKVGVRNIKSFNSRPVVEQPDLFGGDDAPEEKKETIPQKVPYIVIVVDELADLMLVAQAEIENSIARLAQLSRAVGIHMILATQRPSVNVITGTIKANFPARVAFQVAQKVDSRTILDAPGADKLLGKGDMLFLPPGSSKLIRSQGTMTSDDEIRDIVEFIKAQGGPQYEGAIKEKIESKAANLPELGEDDDMLEAAIEVIRQTRRASTSSLQRRLRIGYTRAARLMDLLEEQGVIGPPQGSDPREILIDLDGEIPQHDAESEVIEPRGD
jgi:DNA segregation ATPase FtsK/SpoIIIE, S-DNA-T family